MSYAMTHLLIANEFADRKGITDKDFFLLAAISPDTVHCREGFAFQMKCDAHQVQPDVGWGRIYTEEQMLIWYDRLKDFYTEKLKLVANESEMLFLKGYVLHILTDIFNTKILYAPLLISYELDSERMRPTYRKECIIQDNYFYQNYPKLPQIMNMIAEAAASDELQEIIEHLELGEYFSIKNVNDYVSVLTEGYETAEKASFEGLSMLSKEASEEYLRVVTEETEKMLYDFPDPKRTFAMD